ncbi:hypothetical protein QNI16_31060 [Cytophagaceae bacterium YF14B1]|uniref:Lipoprotein n=1 Tax=Xanthocytophaga flava TaxID=3048013 RepID=A0AAE3QT85_9BACT|nr:hypothetical protein [Xanthocytophaga flavus]MDJ1484980.1 hypothetical protein [Xanthocytophaga flavus]
MPVIKILLFIVYISLLACNSSTKGTASASEDSVIIEKDTLENPIESENVSVTTFKEVEDSVRGMLLSDKIKDSLVTNTVIVLKRDFFKHSRKDILFLYKDSDATCNAELYTYKKNHWTLKQKIDSLDNSHFSYRLEDYNGDHIKDILVFIGTGMRGANSMENLLVVDPRKERLIVIAKFADLCQARYNPKDNSIRSLELTSGWHSEKYRWSGYELVLVETQDCMGDNEWVYRSIYKVVNKKEILIQKDSITFKEYVDSESGENGYSLTYGPEGWDERFKHRKKRDRPNS